MKILIPILMSLILLTSGEHPKPHHEYHPVHYSYGYKVNDEYKGLDFGHNENRDGYKTEGAYHVLLPDGRVQTVKYHVDGYGGYIADVSYSNPHKPAPYHPTPAPYHPPPPPPPPPPPKPHYGYPHH